ncbi:MAG: PD40 domain-containing protein, partial [Ferruginibacter sp.]|nr:PD40 domain-containing protein [Ferruginibacter sp.]
MKKLYLLFIVFFCRQYVTAQPAYRDSSGRLKAKKDLVINSETILKIENLGTNINTDLPELRPTISADGNLLFFICQNHPENTKYNEIRNSQDIWFSEKDSSSGKWGPAVHLGYPLNTYYFNAVFWIAPDNNRILIRNAFINGDYFGNGVSMCYLKEDGLWSKPNMLRIKNYAKYDRGRQNGAFMANNGQTLLYYMSDQLGGLNNELYVSFLEKDDTWTEPKSLGKKINLKNFNHTTPYMAPDNVTLYFSSNRPGGMGYMDIWMCRRLDDTWQKWSDPVNLGSPINTDDMDTFFTMDAGGEYAYMSTDLHSYGESDIVRIKLLERER